MPRGNLLRPEVPLPDTSIFIPRVYLLLELLIYEKSSSSHLYRITGKADDSFDNVGIAFVFVGSWVILSCEHNHVASLGLRILP